MKYHVASWPKKAPRQRFGTTILRGPPQRLHGVCLHLGPQICLSWCGYPMDQQNWYPGGTSWKMGGFCGKRTKHVEHVWFPARQKWIAFMLGLATSIWTFTDWTIRFSADEKRNGLEDDGPMYGNWGLAIGCTNGQNEMPEEVPPSELLFSSTLWDQVVFELVDEAHGVHG